MPTVSMKQLLEAGVHFGHQTKKWNPKMAPYIYGERNGIYIINLQKTVKKLEEAYHFIKEVASNGGTILFAGTKKQAQDAIRDEAGRCGMFFVNQRWPGGLLTNFQTVKKSIARLREIEEMKEQHMIDSFPIKEAKDLERDMVRLERLLGGVKKMLRLPDVLFIVDLNKERNAMLEAKKLGIPVVALVDTNCDPDEADYVIPGNDDAIRAVKLFTSLIADAVLEGKHGEQVMGELKVEEELLTEEEQQKLEELAKEFETQFKEDFEA